MRSFPFVRRADKSETRAGLTSGDLSMNAMARLLALTILGCAVSGTPLVAATYKWVDDTGAVHYSQTPPANRDYELLRKPPSIKEEPAAPAPESQAPTPAASPPAEDKEARERPARRRAPALMHWRKIRAASLSSRPTAACIRSRKK